MKKFKVKSTYQIKATMRTTSVDDFKKDCESKGGFGLVMGEVEVKKDYGFSIVEVSYDFVDIQMNVGENSETAKEAVKNFLETKDGGIYSTEPRKSVISQEIIDIDGEVEMSVEILISHAEAENNLLEMDMNNIDEVALLESTAEGQRETIYSRKMCEAVVFHSENFEKTKDGLIIYKEQKMADTNKKTEELSINQAMGQLYKQIGGHKLKDNNKILKSFQVLEKALTKAADDNHRKIQEIASILQEEVVKDFKQYNSK